MYVLMSVLYKNKKKKIMMRHAVFSIIICLPNNSEILISTDSQNVIHTFKYLTLCNPSARKKLKISNHSIWLLLLQLIQRQNINLTFHKVKAHSDIWPTPLPNEDVLPDTILPKYINNCHVTFSTLLIKMKFLHIYGVRVWLIGSSLPLAYFR